MGCGGRLLLDHLEPCLDFINEGRLTEKTADIFFRANTQEAAGDEMFYGALRWWVPPFAPRYLPMRRGVS
jgi:hypothetical protein